MKRIKAACICQTLHFMLKDNVEHDYAVRLVREEVERYKQSLDRNHTKYRIEEETNRTFSKLEVFNQHGQIVLAATHILKFFPLEEE